MHTNPWAAIAGVSLLWGAMCRPAGADEPPELAPVVVTATRVAESSADLPASIDRSIGTPSSSASCRSTYPSR